MLIAIEQKKGSIIKYVWENYLANIWVSSLEKNNKRTLIFNILMCIVISNSVRFTVLSKPVYPQKLTFWSFHMSSFPLNMHWKMHIRHLNSYWCFILSPVTASSSSHFPSCRKLLSFIHVLFSLISQINSSTVFFFISKVSFSIYNIYEFSFVNIFLFVCFPH